MDPTRVRDLFDREMRRGAQADGPTTRVERDGPVVRHVGEKHDWNGVLWSDLDETTADAAIAQQLRYFATLGHDFEWKLYAHDRPHDLGARLRAAGFAPEAEESLMVAHVADLSVDASLPDGVRLLTVTDPTTVALAVRVHERVFGTDGTGLRRHLLSHLDRGSETVETVVALADDEPLCSARVEFHPGTDFASLWGGGTVPAWRGRGIYRALVAHRARLAAARGYSYLQVDASSQSCPILRRLGFTVLSTTTPYAYRRGKDRGLESPAGGDRKLGA
jgi:GNAT superfamily N-acetyltransferase